MDQLKVYFTHKSIGVNFTFEYEPTFTVRNFLYVVCNELQLKRYMDYGLFYEVENENLLGISDLEKTLQFVMQILGHDTDLILKRRIFPPKYIWSFQSIFPRLSERELDLTFLQLRYMNLKEQAYLEEATAIKQAAILEAIKLKERNVPEFKKAQLPFKEIGYVFPEHLLTFFNKRKVLKGIKEAKVDLSEDMEIEDLQIEYLKISCFEQVDVFSFYYPVIITNVLIPDSEKKLKDQFKSLQKSLFLLGLSPTQLFFAIFEPKKASHKKKLFAIEYEQIMDVKVVDDNKILVAFGNELLDQVFDLESVFIEEIIYQLTDYIRLARLTKGIHKELQVSGSTLSKRAQSENLLNESSLDLDNAHKRNQMRLLSLKEQLFSYEQCFYDQKELIQLMETKFEKMHEELVGAAYLVKMAMKKPAMVQYLEQNAKEGVLEQVKRIQRVWKAKYYKHMRIRLMKAIIKIQSFFRGTLVRLRLQKHSFYLIQKYSAIKIQKVYRGHRLRRLLFSFLATLK